VFRRGDDARSGHISRNGHRIGGRGLLIVLRSDVSERVHVSAAFIVE
jgi:hypothetical protein